MGKILVNPFFIYIYTFIGVFAVYSLNWSNLYPRLTTSTIVFFIATFIISCLIGIWINKYGIAGYSKISCNSTIRIGTLIVFVILLIEIIYNRAVPLVKILSGQAYNFRDFSFPLLHHLLGTFAPFLATISFHYFLSEKKITSLVYCLLNTVPSILLFHRSVVVIIFLNCIFVFVMSGGLRNFKRMILIFILFLSFIYVFGVAGNLRVQSEIDDGKEFLVTALMNGTEATAQSYDSNIAQNFYWFYLYAASPLANFQNTINKSKGYDLNLYNIGQFLIQEICPDILSKRINSILDKEEFQSPLERVIYFLTVGTIYADSFVYLGWLGPILMFMFISTLVSTYIILIRNSPFYVAGIATLATMMSLSVFSNMVVYTPLSFQLIYPLVLPMAIAFITSFNTHKS